MMQPSGNQAPIGQEAPSRDVERRFADPTPEALALLHEVDHRVKNNLQLIASLIQLQARRTEDAGQRLALKTVLERVNAVTTVHRRLFRGDVLRFDAADFLRDLAGDVAAAAGRDDIEIALMLQPVQIPAASAAPFALIANELIGNALKHAFPERAGRVCVTLDQEGEACVLTVADDGVGLNDAAPGFGLTLVRLLCQQLHAELDLRVAGGATAVIRTPLAGNHA